MVRKYFITSYKVISSYRSLISGIIAIREIISNISIGMAVIFCSGKYH